MNVKVKQHDGNVYEIPCNYDTTCEQLKNKIKDFVDFMPTEQKLIFNQVELSNPNEKLITYGIQNGSIVNLTFQLQQFTVVIGRQDCKPINISVSSNDSVQRLKEKISTSWNIPIEQQTLIFGNETLENDKKLSDYRIVKECSILLIPRVSKQKDEIQVIVITNCSQNISIKVNVKECISNLKSKIQQRLNIKEAYVSLIYQAELLHDDKTIDYYDIGEHSVILVHLIMKATSKIKIFVKCIDGRVFESYIARHATIMDIKENIHQKLQIDPGDQRLIFQGAIISNDCENIDEYQICENSVIQIVPRMRFTNNYHLLE